MKNLAVLTPTYNRAFIIERTYKSLVNQTSKDFVWYVVDDGSKDNTKEIIDKFIEENVIEIKYIFKNNGGKHTAINEGLKFINEDIVVILDSDDCLTEDAVQTIIGDYNLIKDDNQLCGLSYLKKDFDNNIVGKCFTENYKRDTFVNQRFNKNTYGDKLEVFKTHILKQFPFPEFPNERFLSETIIWSSISGAYEMIFINKALYVCEYLEGGLSSNIRKHLFQNPVGAYECYNVISNRQFKLKYRIKHTLLYILYSKASGKSFREIRAYAKNKYLSILLYPFGVLLFKNFRIKYSKV